MRILTICWAGDNRSVHLAHLLKVRGHDALAVSLLRNSRSTRNTLYEWADKIILLVPSKQHWIPDEYKNKLEVWEGFAPDIWGWKNNPKLLEMLETRIDAELA